MNLMLNLKRLKQLRNPVIFDYPLCWIGIQHANYLILPCFLSSQKRSKKYHCSSTLAWCHVFIGLFHRVSLHFDLPLYFAEFYTGKECFQLAKLGLRMNAGGNLHTVLCVEVRILPKPHLPTFWNRMCR